MAKHSRHFFSAKSGGKRLPAVALVLLSTLLLASCSSTKMGYEFIDWLAMWKIDRMVKLDSQQRSWTKDQVHELHHWHRTTQLPRYADYLEEVQQRLANGEVTAAEIHAETDRVQLMMDEVVEQLLPAATELTASFTDDQVKGFLDRVAEERQEYIDEHVEPGVDKWREEKAQSFKDHSKRFLGRLTKEQEAWVDQWSRNLIPYAELAAEQQLLWQEHLTKYLTMRDNKELLQQGLRELLLHRSDNWNEELQAATDANQEMTYGLIAQLLNNMTEKQQKRLHKEIQTYISDFRELARKGQ